MASYNNSRFTRLMRLMGGCISAWGDFIPLMDKNPTTGSTVSITQPPDRPQSV